MIESISDYTPTNGDKIREMVDSELAKVIACPYNTEPDLCNNIKKGCYYCHWDWLEQLAERGEDE